MAVTPFGREEADRVYVPETVPTAESFRVTVSSVPGATMRGCGELIESVPVEEPELEVEEVVLEVLEYPMVEDVRVDSDTIGIAT